jgi:hypothetical protein
MFSLLNCETTTKRRISDTPDIQDQAEAEVSAITA